MSKQLKIVRMEEKEERDLKCQNGRSRVRFIILIHVFNLRSVGQAYLHLLQPKSHTSLFFIRFFKNFVFFCHPVLVYNIIGLPIFLPGPARWLRPCRPLTYVSHILRVLSLSYITSLLTDTVKKESKRALSQNTNIV